MTLRFAPSLALWFLGTSALAQSPSPAPSSPPPAAPPSTPPAANGSVGADWSFTGPSSPAPAAPAPAPAKVPGAAATPSNADPATTDTLAREARWREAGRYEMPTLSGSTGLLRVANATAAPAGTFRVQMLYDYFSAKGFLCTASAPCLAGSEDRSSRFGMTLAASAAVTSFLEGYAAVRSYATTNDRASPQVLQVLGDTTLGVKIVLPTEPYQLFHVGGDAQLLLVNGTGGLGLDGGGTSGRLRANTTLDFRNPATGLPLLVHANLAYRLDNSGHVIAATESNRGQAISRIERFGLGINRTDALELGLGLEGFWTPSESIRYLRPFVEYTVDVPMNRQGYLCTASRSSLGDTCLANNATFRTTPSRLTFGGRVNPWLPGLMATAALDIGVSGTGTFVEEVAPQAPWTLWLGVGYGFDIIERAAPAPVVRPVAAPPAAPKYALQGFVHEVNKPDGLARALVLFENQDLTGMVTNQAGRFVTTSLEPGAYTFRVRAEGYQETTCSATIQPVLPAAPAFQLPGGTPVLNNNITEIDCALEATPKLAVLLAKIVSSDANAPVVGASVTVTGSNGKEQTMQSDANGALRVEALPPGPLTARATHKDHMVATEKTEVKAGQDTPLTLTMTKRPLKPNVVVGKREISIKQQIHFETDSAVILPDSTALVQEIADSIMNHPRITVLEIQGHTDNVGTAQRNKVLSQERADAVRERLISFGIDGNRLRAKGYGADRPVLPNVVAANRGRNRRVAFVIVEQDASKP